MSTLVRAILLGGGLGVLSGLGTFIGLLILLFGQTGRMPLWEMLPFFLIVLAPGVLFSFIAANQPIDPLYQKAIALGLLVPAIGVCTYYALGLGKINV